MTEPFKKPGTEWTKDQIAYISKLADRGLSSSQIGAKVGLTRNAIIGALSRHGPEGWKKVRKRAVANKRNKTSFAPKPLDPKVTERAEKRAEHTHDFSALRQEGLLYRLPETGGCKFIFGDVKTENFSYCGHKALPNGSYCQTHHDFCHTNDKWLGGRPRLEAAE